MEKNGNKSNRKYVNRSKTEIPKIESPDVRARLRDNQTIRKPQDGVTMKDDYMEDDEQEACKRCTEHNIQNHA